MAKRSRPGLFALIALAAAAALCAAAPARAQTDAVPIIIGSKAFTENRILAEIMAQLIEAHTEIPVVRRTNLGGTKVVFSALRHGEINLYPEYTGTGWTILLKVRERVDSSLRAYLHVEKEFKERYGLTWLLPFGFNNSYALAMREDAAEELGITRISDLKAFQERLRVGFSHEFLNREDGCIGLARLYGLEFADLRGMEHGLAYEAIRTNRIDIIDTWTTDGKLLKYNIRILEDDRRFFPPYDAAPLIRTDVLERYPQVGELLNRLAFKIPDKRMQELNFQVEERGGSYKEVARLFLQQEGLLSAGIRGQRLLSIKKEGLLDFIRSRAGPTLELALEHLLLTAVAVLLAILVAVPLGIILTRRKAAAPPFIGLTGVIQTIPSLALLAFMIPIPFLGLGVRSAIAALFLYALLPIVRNTYTGITEVDPDLIEAASGMGLKDHQVLLKIELPLATRTIMAGIRTSTVISIGVATLAAFIGAGGLGEPIITGLQLNNTRLILSGAVPAALLAIIVDFLLGRVEAALAPRSST